MDNAAKAIKQSHQLHKSAASALHAGDFKLAETLYRTAIETITSILDPLHTDYVDLLKGLRTALNKQNKPEEVIKVDQMIAQLCLGQ